MITQLTWWTPDKKTKRRLQKAMVIKALFFFMSSIVLFGAAYLTDYLFHIEPRENRNMYLWLFLIFVFCFFYLYRAALRYGTTRPYDEEELFNGFNYKWCFVMINLFIAGLIIIILESHLVIKIVLFAFMAIFTYWKEYLMLMLFFMSKYDVKNGNILSNNMEFKIDKGFRYRPIYLIYNLQFEDDMGRIIPVIVPSSTYMYFKDRQHPTDAVLVRYKCGNLLLFDLVRI